MMNAGLFPFASRWRTVGPHRLHYIDEGRGELIVMLHGNPTWSFYYRRLIEEFRQTHRVIVPDHMGMGLSDKPQDYPYTLQTHIDNLDRLLAETAGCGKETEGVTTLSAGAPAPATARDSAALSAGRQPPTARLTLVLHDWGGAIGMGYAVRHPERIRRLVILNTSAFLSPRIPLRINVCRLPGFGALAVRGCNAFARCALSMATAKPESMTPEVRAVYLQPYNSWAHRVGILRFVQDIPRHAGIPSHAVMKEIEAGLPRFRNTPMLIQWGGRDWCFDHSFLAGWRLRFPEARVDLYEDAGHYVLEDAHERILPRLRWFLDRE